MAEARTVDSILEELAGCFGKHPNWVQSARVVWIRTFSRTPDAALQLAARAWMDDPDHEHPPTPAKLKAAIEAASPAERVQGCARCSSGLLEIAVHRRIDGEVVIAVGVVSCSCDAGARIRHPRIPTYAGQRQHMEGDPTVLTWFERPSGRQRESLDAPPPAPRSDVLRQLRAGLDAFARNADAHASARARAIEAEREREEAW